MDSNDHHSAHQKQGKEETKKDPNKKDPIWREREERVNVLDTMFVTALTFQAERSPLKDTARRNTAPPPEQTSSTIKTGTCKERERK